MPWRGRMLVRWTNYSLVTVNFPFRAYKNPSSYCSILMNFIKCLQFFNLLLLVVCLMPSNWYPIYLAFYHISNCRNRPLLEDILIGYSQPLGQDMAHQESGILLQDLMHALCKFVESSWQSRGSFLLLHVIGFFFLIVTSPMWHFGERKTHKRKRHFLTDKIVDHYSLYYSL